MARKHPNTFDGSDFSRVKYGESAAKEPSLDPGEYVDTKIGRMPVFNHHDNQAPEDQHGPGYDNDASGWVRGAAGGGAPTGNNEDGRKPTFDLDNPWRSAGRAYHHVPKVGRR